MAERSFIKAFKGLLPILRIAKITLICLVVPLLFASSVISGKNVRGPAFSGPDNLMEMPADWQERTVKHESADADLVVTLDGQMYHAWEPIIQKYAKENSLKIVVNNGTCGVAAGGLTQKSIDMGVFCCPPDRTDRLPGVRFHTLGIAAIALIIHPDNPHDNVTLEQARQLFGGAQRNWSGTTLKKETLVLPVGRLHCKLRPGHWRLLLDNKELFSPDLFEVGAMPDMIAKVAANPGAIGYETLWMMRYYEDRGRTRFLKINGYSPDDPANVVSLKYPLYRVYSYAVWEGRNLEKPHARKLGEYLMQQAEQLEAKYSFIPASALRKAGWKFRGNELTGEPE
ncbi:MAG: hypothetical protein C4581_05085 [Nitrospiraceae bacterium]|nr:MAG: hypothetical protein C4581_05085 [Nitrospiraceae bacterium]